MSTIGVDMRKIKFQNGEYFHIYNRGVEKRRIFTCDADYVRFLVSLKEFNTTVPVGGLYEKYLREKRISNVPNGHLMSKSDSKLVEIIAYCLNPNHFHLILVQLEDDGIAKFMQKIGNGYTKYFNHHYNRSGVLFQGVFKSIHINSNEYLLYLSAYINQNHFIHGYGPKDWKYSSFPDYLGKRNGELCKKDIILRQFKTTKQYEEFMNKNALHLRKNKEITKYLIEE